MSEIERLQAEISDLTERLAKAKAALLAERFKDIPRRAVGDLVLVRRSLFGKARWWPARIVHVHLSYNQGRDAKGEPWETHHVSYAVNHELRDGSYDAVSTGYGVQDVQDVPGNSSGRPGGRPD